MKRKEFATEESSAGNSRLKFKDESDVGVIASHVFGAESPKTILAVDPLTKETTDKTILENTRVWVHKVLDIIDPPLRASEIDNRPGRLGLPQVRFDSSAQVGTLIMSADRLSAQAQSNFSTVKANVCFYSGKWQYELQLESKGVMQLGWAMAEGEFTPETGVGDNIYSFAYDGNRIRKWNMATTEYGEGWQAGDIIGCVIDLDDGNIHFYRNGRDMGEAFSSLARGPGCVYFPAVSLAFEEKVQANFGAMPFRFPIDGYQPAQQPPTAVILRTNQLLHWLFRSSTIPKYKPTNKAITSDSAHRKDSLEAAVLMICEVLMKPLMELLSRPFIIEACLMPFLQDITAVTVDKKSLPARRSLEKLNFICDTFQLFFEPDNFKDLLNTICKCLIQKCNQTPVSLDYSKQKGSLVLLADLASNYRVRMVLLRLPGFVRTRLPELMELKIMDATVLKQIVPTAWWPMEPHHTEYQQHYSEYEQQMRTYLNSCQKVEVKSRELEQLQENLLEIFLNNSDATETVPSSRKYFLHMLRIFLKENHLSGLVSFFLNNQNTEPTPLPVALSYFHRLAKIVKRLWETECGTVPVHVPLVKFYDGSIDYFTIDRVGGVLSHLVHTFQAPLATELGTDHRVLTNPPQAANTTNVQIQVRGLDANTGAISSMTRWINLANPAPAEPQSADEVLPEPLSNQDSLIELLDGVVLLYNLAAHRQLHKVSKLRDEMDKYIKSLNEAKLRLSVAKKTNPDSAREIEASIKVFEHKLEEQSRVMMVWVRGAVYTADKRASLVWLLRVVLSTLERASQQGDLFAFVPEFYIETMVELCVSIRSYFSPTLPLQELSDHKKLMVQVAEFLAKHFSDPRVVNHGCKDAMIEGLAGFIARQPTLEYLENMSLQSQQRLVTELLKPYDNRPWGQSNWILMRMWHGCGFAFRYNRSPHLSRKMGPRTMSADSNLLIHQTFDPCPSQHFQQLVAQTLNNDQHTATAFLNSVLKQLNWSFSEFISMMQEIQNLSKRPERVIIDARQLKICATCFDFVLGLLRVLEMVCFNCRQVFTDMAREGSENLLERLSQLLSQILLRVTVPKGCFNHVISLEVPDLDAIDQFPVLTAVVGVLMALLADDITNDKDGSRMSVAARSLLSEPAFKIETLKYVLGETEPVSDKQEKFSFRNYSEAVNAAELEQVTKLISVLTRYKNRMSQVSEVEDEDLLCPICCALPLAVTFTPCTHQSCKSCITHHLMNSKECFFCKASILRVTSNDGSLIFEAPPTLDSTNQTGSNG